MERSDGEVVGPQPRAGPGHPRPGIWGSDECYHQAVGNRGKFDWSIPSIVCADVHHSMLLHGLDVVEEGARLSSGAKGHSEVARSQRAHRLLRDIWNVLFVAVSPSCRCCRAHVSRSRLSKLWLLSLLAGALPPLRPVRLTDLAGRRHPNREANYLIFFFGPPATETTALTNSTSSYNASIPAATSSERLGAVGAAMLGVLGSAGAFTALRWIGKRAHVVISVNYFATWCTIVSMLALTLAEPLHLSTSLHFALPNNLRQWGMLLFLGICGFFTQLLLTNGLAAGGRVNSARAVNLTYTQMLFALALDKLVFGQTPGWWSLAGGGLILGSAIFVAMQRQEGDGAADEAAVAVAEEEEIGMLSIRSRRETRAGEGVCEELGV
jgi:hypothetical protein